MTLENLKERATASELTLINTVEEMVKNNDPASPRQAMMTFLRCFDKYLVRSVHPSDRTAMMNLIQHALDKTKDELNLH
jgi:hypothetical protein